MRSESLQFEYLGGDQWRKAQNLQDGLQVEGQSDREEVLNRRRWTPKISSETLPLPSFPISFLQHSNAI